MHDFEPYSRTSLSTIVALCVIFALMFCSCGDAGGGSVAPPAPPTLTIQDLAGYYELTGFTIWNPDTGETIDQDDVSHWYGKMGIYEDFSVYQFGEIYGIWGYWGASILEIQNDAVEVSSGGITYWVAIDFDKEKGTLTTTERPGTASDWREIGYWQKISGKWSGLVSQEVLKEGADLQGKFIGNAVSELWNYVP